MKRYKVLAWVLSMALISSSVLPTFADNANSTGSVKEDITNETVIGQDTTQAQKSEYAEAVAGDNVTNIYATIASVFDVTIPKTIILDGKDKVGNYSVKIDGDIAGNENVVVIPEESFAMKQSGKEDVTASVEQDKTDWTYNQFDTMAVGTVTADGLSAGSWNGSFNFNISKKLIAGAQEPERPEVHTHVYEENITTEATCTTSGVKTFVCACGDSYTETIEAFGHNYVDAKCTECNKVLEAGLYDVNGIMLASWEESGIDIETDYTQSTYKTATASPYYVLTNNYPTATKVVLPDSVTSIGQYAFNHCSYLTSIEIPDSVTSIGQNAFEYCSDLTSIEIPDSVTSIGHDAFDGCTGLTSVVIGDSVTSIGDFAFYSCTSLTSIDIPDSVTSIGKNAFNYCKSLTSVVIGDSVTSIGQYAFYGCTSLTSVTWKGTTYTNKTTFNTALKNAGIATKDVWG